MAYGDNKPEYEAGAPKKADVLIRSTQHIALKQEELSEQTKQAISRIDEAIELFSKNNQDASYVVKQSGEIFSQLQGENSALKQELLYLAKQSENIYAGLAEKITELSDQAKTREDAMNGLADRINDVAEQTKRSEEAYASIADKLTELSEQNKRNESIYEALTEKLDALFEHSRKNEKAYSEISDRLVSEQPAQTVEVDNTEILNKINLLSEQIRRSDGAHSMLADKFEILSMRVEQFGFESTKSAPPAYAPAPVQPVAYPAPVQTVVKQEIDYDKLAEKVAALISAREVVSPDYIASKVAEQIVIPEAEAATVNVTVDYDRIARQVSESINANGVRVSEIQTQPVNVQPAEVNVNIDEEGLAQRLAEKLGGLTVHEAAPVQQEVVIDEDSLAEKIASKVGGVKVQTASSVSPVTVNSDIDEEELADSIALKVGSLRPEDFDILVDDNGCTSISKGIADNLNYEMISNIIADKLRDALDLAAVNAPDYEEMAERISEKITVAGVNEDAIADKAAAVLSNYLPEFDTDEIADKVTGAVIDVVSAIPQPTIDSEAICNSISERLIESQEDHDYDIVIDDDGISKITELVTEEIENGTVARFEKLEDELSKISSILEKAEEEKRAEAELAAAKAEEETETQTELEKGASARFDKVDEDIAKLTELVANAVSVEDEEEYEEYAEEEDYTALSEVVAAEIEKSVASRLDSVEENINRICELLTEQPEEEISEDEDEGEYEEYAEEEDYTALSEVVAAEIEKSVASRLDSVEENINRICELLTEQPEEEIFEDEGEEEVEDYVEEEDYTALSEVVAAEIEKGVSARLDGMNEGIDGMRGDIEKLTRLVEGGVAVQTASAVTAVASDVDVSKITEAVTAELHKSLDEKFEAVQADINNITEIVAGGVATEVVTQKYEEDYSALSDVLAVELEENVNSRLDAVKESIARIAEIVTSSAENLQAQKTEEDYSAITGAVAEIEKSVSSRLSAVEESIARMTGIVASSAVNEAVSENRNADYSGLSEVVAVEVERGMKARFDKVEEDIAKVTELVNTEIANANNARMGKVEEDVARIAELVNSEKNGANDDKFDKLHDEIAKLSALVESERASAEDVRYERLHDEIANLSALVNGGLANGGLAKDDRLDKFENDVAEIKAMLADGIIAAQSAQAVKEAAPVQAVEEVAEEEEDIPLVTVSDLVPPEAVHEEVKIEEPEEFEEDEEEEDDDDDGSDSDDFLIDVLDMDRFSDNELMPGEMSDYAGGVDFANMMKFKRSFIARIIQSSDEYKQYYGEVKHALLSYKKVNSNVAWGAERFNKGRETIARMKIRGKTLCLYLALDPNNYKTSVYHHLDVSDNKSVNGTPMMVKIKSNLGVRKALRLIDEMLALRNGEKKEIPERDYAAMYPYETIEELIEDGLVKDVRKK